MGKEKSDKKKKDVPQEDVEMLDGEERVSSLLSKLSSNLLNLQQASRKSKKEKGEIIIPLEDLCPIAHPLADKKLAKKLHKTIKRGLPSEHLYNYQLNVSHSLQSSTS